MKNNIHGWINLYKPVGISSARLVAVVKKSFSGQKIGHAGTLDPEAEGVLPIAIGEATKLTQALIDAQKEYIFTIQFGSTSTTGDRAGEIEKHFDHYPSIEQVLKQLPYFLGSIEQVPPKYSAIKIDGQRAYKLARSGADFIIKPRIIHIYGIELLSYNQQDGRVQIRAVCSKGTYIRTLAEDISLSLQNCGYVIELRRTRVGRFLAANAVDVSHFIAGNWQKARSLLQDSMLQTEIVLDDIPVLDAKIEQARQIKCGQQVRFDQNQIEACARSTDAILTDSVLLWVRCEGKLVAIGHLHECLFKSQRAFNLVV